MEALAADLGVRRTRQGSTVTLRGPAGIFGFAVTMAVAMGAAILLVDSRTADFPSVLAIFVIVVLPASLPMAIVGGVLAALVVRVTRLEWSLWSCAATGAACGAALGALGCVLWFGAINFPDPGTLQFLLAIGPVGGIAGTPVGAAVGTYVWWVSRRVPPNKQMQLTRPAQAMEPRS